MPQRELSVIIPARNEIFLQKTVDDILENIEADTEIIVICDGCWPDPPLQDHPRVVVVHHTVAIGQRAATNEGARISQAKIVAKVDAHCSFGKGFDRILIEDCRYGWTMTPAMWNLHAYDWVCRDCGNRIYQGHVNYCGEKTRDKRDWSDKGCGSKNLDMDVVWKPREKKVSYSWRFDNNMQFQYWRKHAKQYEGDLIETMSIIGNFFLMHRKRFKRIGGLDEKHGSWGQYGTEIACKTWLSGGKLVTSKKTWFAHLFRTGNFRGSGFRGSSFPYPLDGGQQEHAKLYSRDLWLNDKWPKAKKPLSWLVDKFRPVPGWHDNA